MKKLIFLCLLLTSCSSKTPCQTVKYEESDRYNTQLILAKDTAQRCEKKLKEGQSEVHPVIYIIPSVLLGIVIGTSLRGYR